MTANKIWDDDKGVGFYRHDGKKALVRCRVCNRENYASNVLSGECAWCGYDCNNHCVKCHDTGWEGDHRCSCNGGIEFND